MKMSYVSTNIFVSIFFLHIFLSAVRAVNTDYFKLNSHCEVDGDLWLVYKHLFEVSNTILITNLCSDETSTDINGTLTNIIQRLNVTVVISNIVIPSTEIATEAEQLKNAKGINSIKNQRDEVHVVDTEIYSTKDQQAYKINTNYDWNLAFELKNASLILGETATFNLILKKNIMPFIHNHRSLYVLIFSDDIQQTFIAKILKRFWTELKILNVIAHSLCSGNWYIYFYDPFYLKDNGEYGALRKYTLKEVALNKALVIHSLENLNGYNLNVSMFVRIPTAFKKNALGTTFFDLKRSGGYLGLDGALLSSLAEQMNFTVTVSSPKSSGNFGDVLVNGSITGSLADVVYGRCDFGGNSRFLTDYETKIVEFTQVIHTEQICLIVPKAQRIPRSKAYFNCFNLESWILILVIFMICVVFRYCFHFISYDSEGQNSRLFFETCCILLGISVKLAHVQKEHIFLSCYMIFSIIFVGIFQGSLVKSYSVISFSKDIDSIEDLIQSDLPTVTSLKVLDTDESTLIRKLFLKKKPTIAGKSLSYIREYRNISTLERKRDMEFYMKYYFTDANDVELLHIVKECLITYSVGYIVPKGSVYLKKFDDVIFRFVEGGFTEKWYRVYVDFVIMKKMLWVSYNTTSKFPLKLKDVKGAFLCLVFGIFVAFFTFICELFRSGLNTFE